MVHMKIKYSSYYGKNSSKATYKKCNFLDNNDINDNMNIVNVPLIWQPINVSVEQIIILIWCNQMYGYSFAYIHLRKANDLQP